MKRIFNLFALFTIVLAALFSAMPAQPVLAVDACTAFNFTGSQYVTVAEPLPTTATSSLTIETWVYPTDTSGVKSIVRWGTNTHLYIADGTLYIEVWSNSTDTSTWKQYHSAAPATIPTNQWTHVAMVWDKVNSTVKLYVNGVDENAVQISSGTISPTEPFHIGYSTAYGQGFLGNMDEFRIWNTARTASEILNNKNLPLVGNESGLVALFHFDDSVTTDAAGGDNTGTPSGATLVSGSLVPAVCTTYTVTFDANGGSGSMNPQAAAAPAALTSNAFTRSGYSFTGWNTTANGSGTAYANGATYNFSANVTLYAQWSQTPTSASFGDVPTTHPYFADIEILYANGFTVGCSSAPLLFCPETTIDRAQAAVFMLRSLVGTSYVPPVGPFANTFGDNWGPGPWAQRWAQGMLEQGLTAGCSSSGFLYCPWEQMPRAQAAVFGMRLLNGSAYLPPAGTGTVFADVSSSDWYAGWAEQAYLNGLLPACGSSGGRPLFCPNSLVSRGLGAYMIVRARNLSMP